MVVGGGVVVVGIVVVGVVVGGVVVVGIVVGGVVVSGIVVVGVSGIVVGGGDDDGRVGTVAGSAAGAATETTTDWLGDVAFTLGRAEAEREVVSLQALSAVRPARSTAVMVDVTVGKRCVFMLV